MRAIRGAARYKLGQLEWSQVRHWAGSSIVTAVTAWVIGGYEGGYPAVLGAILATLGKGVHGWLSDNTKVA